MSATQVLEFETSLRENRNGEPAGMRIKIELSDNADLTITGTSTGAYGGESFMGTLTLRKPMNRYEGGDECWVNGVWVSPCPATEPEGEDPLIPEVKPVSGEPPAQTSPGAGGQ